MSIYIIHILNRIYSVLAMSREAARREVEALQEETLA